MCKSVYRHLIVLCSTLTLTHLIPGKPLLFSKQHSEFICLLLCFASWAVKALCSITPKGYTKSNKLKLSHAALLHSAVAPHLHVATLCIVGACKSQKKSANKNVQCT